MRTPIKLDVDYEVSLQGDKFLVTLRFVNSGDDTLVLESPATWDGTFPYPQFPVGAAAELEGNLNFLLAGEQMVNANEFPDDEMIILPGQSREARFLAVPTGKGKKGAAPSGGRVAMYVKQPKAIAGSVGFYVINRARAMPRDYPATVSEWGVGSRASQAAHNQYRCGCRECGQGGRLLSRAC